MNMDPVYVERNGRLADTLDSGDYKQGEGALHVVNVDGTETWCCIGVGCDQAAKDGVELVRTFEHRYGGRERERFDGEASYAPPAVIAHYGWDSKNPALITEENVPVPAAGLNDYGTTATDGPYDFGQIAAAIRRTYGIPQPEKL